MICDSDPDHIDVCVRNALASWVAELLVYLHFQDLSYEHVKLQSLLLLHLRNFKNCSIKFNVVTLKNYTLSSLSHQTLCTILSWCRQHLQSPLSYIALSLSWAPLCQSWFFLPSCWFFVFVFFPSHCSKLFTGEKATGEDTSQVRRWFSKNLYLSLYWRFPFFSSYHSGRWSDETVTARMYSPASCGRTLALCQVSFQPVLDTKEHELLLHPLNIASCPSNTETNPM